MSYESYYNTERMEKARKAAQRDAGLRQPAKRIGQDGRMVMRVPTVAVHNAIRSEGRAVMYPEAQGYWDDMAKRHPEIVVKQRDGSTISMVVESKRSTRCTVAGGKLAGILASGIMPGIPAAKCQS